MSDEKRDEPTSAPLNPALKSSTETVYPTKESTPAPIETASAKENEGEGWPILWLIVTFVCIGLAIYFIV